MAFPQYIYNSVDYNELKINMLLTGDIWSKIGKTIPPKEKKYATISYVTKYLPLLKKGDILICDASIEAIKNGKTSASTLKKYQKKGVKIYSLENLHSKFLISSNHLFVSSSNLSQNSAEILIETALHSQNENDISQAKAFFYNLIDDSIELLEEKLNELIKIKVEKQDDNIPKNKSIIRNLDFGQLKWIVSTHVMSDRVANKEIQETEKAKIKIADKYDEIDFDEISYIRFTGDRNICKKIKEGDQIIEIHTIKKRTKVYESTPVLKVERNNNCTRIYYQIAGKSISFTNFLKGLKKEKINTHVTKNSVREIKQVQFNLINQIIKRTTQ